MFKQVLKYTLAAVIWKRYRALIIATITLFTYFWLVGAVHDDYVSMSEKQGEIANLGRSFAIKWAFLLLGQGAYMLFLVVWRKAPTTEKKATRLARQPSTTQDNHHAKTEEEPEAFKRLREKPKLRSKSDIIIDKYPPKN